MTDYPLPSLAATISATGISAPSYADIFESLKATARSIYGNDIYLESDSQDGQLLATIAQAFFDSNSVAIAAYNSFSPAGAQGIGLSSVVKINGLRRLSSSNSTADLRLIGQNGTVINGGIVEDSNGHKWTLPDLVTIGESGEVTVTAFCADAGAIEAGADTINIISTPTRGWQTATNPAEAVPGQPIETDAALRVRQTVSTALPASAIVRAIRGAILNLSGVSQAQVYENDTDSTDADGLPSHSISAVTVGGDATAIAQTIALIKPPGTGTYGDINVVVDDAKGVPNTIRLFHATLIDITIHVTIEALSGYISTTGDLIKEALAAGDSAQGIGGDIYHAKQFTYANLIGTGLENTFNVTSIAMSRDGLPVAEEDIPIAFNELARCSTDDITLTVS